MAVSYTCENCDKPLSETDYAVTSDEVRLCYPCALGIAEAGLERAQECVAALANLADATYYEGWNDALSGMQCRAGGWDFSTARSNVCKALFAAGYDYKGGRAIIPGASKVKP
jgi:hypothetical protein